MSPCGPVALSAALQRYVRSWSNRVVSHRKENLGASRPQTPTMRRDIVPKIAAGVSPWGRVGMRHRETRTHCRFWQRGAGMAARRARAAAGDTGDRLSQRHVAGRLLDGPKRREAVI